MTLEQVHCMLSAVVQVKPSLLHGDLWSGNLSVVEGGQWAILDPACYYGMSPALHDGEALHLLHLGNLICGALWEK